VRLIITVFFILMIASIGTAAVVVNLDSELGDTIVQSLNITKFTQYTDTPGSFGSFGECLTVANTESSVLFTDCLNGDNYIFDEVKTTTLNVESLQAECIDGDVVVLEFAQDKAMASNTYWEFEGNIDMSATYGRRIPYNGTITYWNIYSSYVDCGTGTPWFQVLAVNGVTVDSLTFPDFGFVFNRPFNLEFNEAYISYDVTKDQYMTMQVTTFSCPFGSPPVTPVALVVIERRCS